jgi:hypothetical protein
MLSSHAGLARRSSPTTLWTPTPLLVTTRTPVEPESEGTTTEEPLSVPATSLVITSTPGGRFVYWPNRKPADLTDGNSRCVAYLESLLKDRLGDQRGEGE